MASYQYTWFIQLISQFDLWFTILNLLFSALSLERDKEGQQQNGKEEGGGHKNYFKPNGMRNNYLSGQQVSPTHRASLAGTPDINGEVRKQTIGESNYLWFE